MISKLRDLLARPATKPFLIGLTLGALAVGFIVDATTTLGLLRNMLLGSILISFVVGFHEFSHLLVARGLGMHVNEFAIGFGPRLAGLRAFGIAWNWRLLPLGGFVSLKGESADEGLGSFSTAPAWKKLLTFAAGPVSNIALAWAMFTLIGMTNFGLSFGDSAGLGVHAIGVVFDATLVILGDGFGAAIATGDINAIPIGSLPQMMTGAGAAVDAGWFMVLLLTGMLSLSVGVMNILPIPPMDGGQMFLITLKSILRDYYPDRFMYRTSIACLVLMTVLGLGLVGLDLVRMFNGAFDQLGELGRS